MTPEPSLADLGTLATANKGICVPLDVYRHLYQHSQTLNGSFFVSALAHKPLLFLSLTKKARIFFAPRKFVTLFVNTRLFSLPK